MNISRFAGLLLTFLLLALTACDQTSEPSTEASAGSAPETQVSQLSDNELLLGIVKLFHAGDEALDLSIEQASELNKTVKAFLNAPSEETLAAAQAQWLQTALAYRQFHYQKQIALVDPEHFPMLNKADFRIGTYPIQPGFIDAFGEYKYSGIVFDAGFELSQESLSELHGLTDVSEVILGIYAIEFMLFNIDGKRDVKDFIAVETLSEEDTTNGYKQVSELPHNRRREVLALQSQILLNDLRELRKAWSGESDGSIKNTWAKLSKSKQLNLAKRTHISAVTQLLLEIGDLNADPESTRELSIPPTILTAELATQQKYLSAALTSCEAATALLAETRQEKVLQLLKEAKEQINQETPESPEEYWQKTFASVKAVADALTKKGDA